MTDRRRINAPGGSTAPPVFSNVLAGAEKLSAQRPQRTRGSDELRKIFLKTGLVPSASGSAYLELEPSSQPKVANTSIVSPSSSLKLTCTVHGPRPLARGTAFTPHLVLSTHVKFAPFAARQRRGYIRDSTERDLGTHLETALRGVIIGDRWPKSGVDVIITVLEGEENRWFGDEVGGGTTGLGSVGGWGIMTVLAGCITAASAAIIDAGIDCVDLVTGGVAALPMSVKSGEGKMGTSLNSPVLDPSPSEHEQLVAACVVAYLSSRGEITELWMKGDAGDQTEELMDRAIASALAARTVLAEVIKESTAAKFATPGDTS